MTADEILAHTGVIVASEDSKGRGKGAKSAGRSDDSNVLTSVTLAAAYRTVLERNVSVENQEILAQACQSHLTRSLETMVRKVQGSKTRRELSHEGIERLTRRAHVALQPNTSGIMA